MKKHIMATALIAALALPAFAQFSVVPSDASQIRDDNHDIRPDRVDQRSDDKGMNSNEARDNRRKKIKQMKAQRKLDREQRNGAAQSGASASDAVEPGSNMKGSFGGH